MNPFEDIDGVDDRQPAYCPYCGQDGAFDAQGPVGENGYQHHCPECGLQFVTFDPEEAEA